LTYSDHDSDFQAQVFSVLSGGCGYIRSAGPFLETVFPLWRECIVPGIPNGPFFGNPRCGFARIRCPDCHAEHLLMFSCRTRGFCPSCHAKRLEEWGEWMREELLLDVPHRQVVFTIPRMLRIFFKYNRRLPCL
jgi:ribosomal protein S27E